MLPNVIPDTEGIHAVANTTNNDRLADIVFIHGLGGFSHSTWRYGKEGKAGHFFWPVELGKDLTNCGVWTLGYPAGITALGNEGMILEKRANNISQKLTNAGLGNRPIILIVHSMGGLIIKHLIVDSLNLPDQNRKRIVSNISAIIFCGTPHKGSGFASAAGFFGRLAGGSQAHVAEMRGSADQLDLLHEKFVEWCSHNALKILSYAENKKLSLTRFLFFATNYGVVVPRASANPNIQGSVIHDADDDHLSLVKPSGRGHDVYAGVLRFINELLPIKQNEASLDGHLTVEVPPVEEINIVNVSLPAPMDVAAKKAEPIPRCLLHLGNEHKKVRITEQRKLVESLKKHKLAWVIADWQVGKESFIASALCQLEGGTLNEVFRLQCGGISNCDELFATSETQFGIAFQEFAAIAAILPEAAIIFDDLTQAIAVGPDREVFETRISSLQAFCPSLNLIFVSRQEPRATDFDKIVSIGPLDESETRNYLRNHSKAVAGLDETLNLDTIYHWSGGLPVNLDRLLSLLPKVPLSEVIHDGYSVDINTVAEPVPESLKNAVAQLAQSQEEHSQHSFKLLKILTVLRDGEVLKDIRRFYNKPFRTSHIEELVSHKLLEDIPIYQTGVNLSLRSKKDGSTTESRSLLRVGRPVRDYVGSIMSDDERASIINASTSLFFGRYWWKDKIRLRNSDNGDTTISGPGNESVVIQFLLGNALRSKLPKRVDRYAMVAIAYCQKLLSVDRFRDTLITSRGLVELFRDTKYDKYYVDCAVIYGRALRMAESHRDCIENLESALERGKGFLIDDYKAEIKLAIALAQKSLGLDVDAKKSATEVVDLTHKDSGEAFQARSILAELTLSGNQRKMKLEALERNARNHGQKVAANNISLSLAQDTDDVKEALELVGKVISSHPDNYSRARAVIEKASVLAKHRRISEMHEDDLAMLSAAYSYCYAQRIGNLLDRCHAVLWQILWPDMHVPQLLRLFRFSSFFWRIRGMDEKDGVYLKQLEVVDLDAIQVKEGQILRYEIQYLERRRRD